MSTKNPYEGAVITTKPQSAAYPTQQQMMSNSSMDIQGDWRFKGGMPITDYKMSGSSDYLVNKNLEFNAYDKKDLWNSINAARQLVSSGQVGDATIFDSYSSLNLSERRQRIEEDRQRIIQAFEDPNPEKWQSLGSVLQQKIQMQNERVGFVNRLAIPFNVGPLNFAHVRVRDRVGVAVVSTSPNNIGFQRYSDRVIDLTEYELLASIHVDKLSLARLGEDMLQDVREDAVEAITTRKDRIWKQAADAVVGYTNQLQLVVGELTPNILARMVESIARWNLPPAYAVMAYDFWTDFANRDFLTALDPVTRFDVLTTGRLANFMGVEIITDGFRSPVQRVLNRGEMYLTAEPQYHAVYLVRDGVQVIPTDGYNQNNTGRGWLVSELYGFAIANWNSVAKVKRIGN